MHELQASVDIGRAGCTNRTAQMTGCLCAAQRSAATTLYVIHVAMLWALLHVQPPCSSASINSKFHAVNTVPRAGMCITVQRPYTHILQGHHSRSITADIAGQSLMKHAGRVLLEHFCSPLAAPAGHGFGRPWRPPVYPGRGTHCVRSSDTLPLTTGHLWHAAPTTKLCVRCVGSIVDAWSTQIAKQETVSASQSVILTLAGAARKCSTLSASRRPDIGFDRSKQASSTPARLETTGADAQAVTFQA